MRAAGALGSRIQKAYTLGDRSQRRSSSHIQQVRDQPFAHSARSGEQTGDF